MSIACCEIISYFSLYLILQSKHNCLWFRIQIYVSVWLEWHLLSSLESRIEASQDCNQVTFTANWISIDMINNCHLCKYHDGSPTAWYVFKLWELARNWYYVGIFVVLRLQFFFTVFDCFHLQLHVMHMIWVCFSFWS